MKNIHIAVDSGKHTSKGLTSTDLKIEKIMFRTKMQLVDDLGIDITPNTYMVDFNGKTYLLGDMVSESQNDYNISKSSITHQLSIYVAIAKLIEKADVMKYGLPKVHLAINTPINIFKSNTFKTEYSNLIKNDGQIISLKINNIGYCFRIASITLMPEGVGTIYSKINEYRDKKVTVIDIGSLNTNYCTYNRLVPDLNSMVISNSGTSILRAKLSESLKSKFGVFIDDSDTEQILKDKCLYIGGEKMTESIDMIKKILNDHVLEIFNFAKSRNITFNNSTLLFVGGGSSLLKDYILEYYQSALIEENSQMSNVFSYLKVLELKNNVQK